MIKIFSIILLFSIMLFDSKKNSPKTLKYIAFGDSYTICTGTVNEKEHWPNILSKHLTESGIKIDLIANPSRNGYTSQNVIDKELYLLNTNSIDFATLLIGVNDWVQGVDIDTYHKNLNICIDAMQKKLSVKKNLILITIPDFGVTPQGSLYSGGRDISKGITEFNNIIKNEAKKRGLICVDVFLISQQMKYNKELIAADELHPSAKEYSIWENLIFIEAKKILLN